MVHSASQPGSSGTRTAQKRPGARRLAEPEPSWHFTLARALGRATRATIGELGAMTRTFFQIVDAANPGPRPTAAASRRKRLARAALLEKLGGVVAGHSEAGFTTLDGDAAFWSLVHQLHALRPRRRAKGPVRKQQPRPVAAIAASSTGAEQPADDGSPGESG